MGPQPVGAVQCVTEGIIRRAKALPQWGRFS
jgi:hypothetical protein